MVGRRPLVGDGVAAVSTIVGIRDAPPPLCCRNMMYAHQPPTLPDSGRVGCYVCCPHLMYARFLRSLLSALVLFPVLGCVPAFVCLCQCCSVCLCVCVCVPRVVSMSRVAPAWYHMFVCSHVAHGEIVLRHRVVFVRFVSQVSCQRVSLADCLPSCLPDPCPVFFFFFFSFCIDVNVLCSPCKCEVTTTAVTALPSFLQTPQPH